MIHEDVDERTNFDKVHPQELDYSDTQRTDVTRTTSAQRDYIYGMSKRETERDESFSTRHSEVAVALRSQYYCETAPDPPRLVGRDGLVPSVRFLGETGHVATSAGLGRPLQSQ